VSAQCDWAIAGDAVILGGGLAGLTAAFYSGAPVYEAAEHPGGAAWSDPVGGIAFDRGIHVLQTSNQSILELLAELGVELSTIRRQAYIYARGTYTAYPSTTSCAEPAMRPIRRTIRNGSKPISGEASRKPSCCRTAKSSGQSTWSR